MEAGGARLSDWPCLDWCRRLQKHVLMVMCRGLYVEWVRMDASPSSFSLRTTITMHELHGANDS